MDHSTEYDYDELATYIETASTDDLIRLNEIFDLFEDSFLTHVTDAGIDLATSRTDVSSTQDTNVPDAHQNQNTKIMVYVDGPHSNLEVRTGSVSASTAPCSPGHDDDIEQQAHDLKSPALWHELRADSPEHSQMVSTPVSWQFENLLDPRPPVNHNSDTTDDQQDVTNTCDKTNNPEYQGQLHMRVETFSVQPQPGRLHANVASRALKPSTSPNQDDSEVGNRKRSRTLDDETVESKKKPKRRRIESKSKTSTRRTEKEKRRPQEVSDENATIPPNHSQLTVLSCPECNITFSAQGCLTRHINEKHALPTFRCPAAGSGQDGCHTSLMARSSSLKRHVLSPKRRDCTIAVLTNLQEAGMLPSHIRFQDLGDAELAWYKSYIKNRWRNFHTMFKVDPASVIS